MADPETAGPGPELGSPDETTELVPRTSAGETLAANAAGETVPSLSPAISMRGTSATLAQSIPGYEILGELGRGGMGVVYKARQLRLNRCCALKMVLAGDHAGPEALARFVAEAETVARLRHPGIVQIYGIGDHDGRTYIELEYVESGSLADRLDGTPWPPRQAAELLETVALAMAEAHRLGIVHRDLKPANVLLGADGSPKVTDFGLAKSLGSNSGLTRTESVLGTPSYMAPEQAEGRTREIGPAADVYSLGAIFYELLTGRPPFRGATVLQTLEQVKHAEPVAPSRLVPGLPRDVETIVLKCLRKDPDRRYADAQALADDVRRFLANEPILARPVGAFERGLLWVKKRPAIAGLLVVVFVVATLGLAGIVWQWDRARHQRDRANEQRARADRQRDRAERFARQAEVEKARSDRQFYAASIGLAQQEWLAYGVARAESLLAQAPPQLRGWEWGYLMGLCRADVMMLEGHSGSVVRVACRGDGRVVTVGEDRTVRTWDAATGQLLELKDAPRTVLAISADGRRIAAADDRDPAVIRVYDLEQHGQPKGTALRGHAGPVRHPVVGSFVSNVAFSHDGRTLVSGGADRTVRLWDVATGRERRVLRGHGRHITAVAISADGSTVASAGGGRFEVGIGHASAREDAEVILWDASSSQIHRRLEGEEVGVNHLAFDPDGRRVAGASFGQWVKVWDRAGTLVATLRGHRNFIARVAFGPDGMRLATASLDQSARLWAMPSGRELFALRGHVGQLVDLAFAPDGRRLVTSCIDGSARVWDIGPAIVQSPPPPEGGLGASQEYRVLGELGSPGQAVDFSPDGIHLAAGNWDGRVRIWELQTGREVRALRAHDEEGVSSVHYSPDGRRLLTAGGGLYRAQPAKAKVWDVADGRLVATIDADGPIASARFSPDGRRIALATGSLVLGRSPGRFQVTDTSGGVICSGSLPAAVTSLDWSADGRSIATAGHDGRVHVRDARTGSLLRSIGTPNSVFRGLAISPVGAKIAAAGGNSGGKACPVFVWDLESGRELLRLPGHPQTVNGVAFSPDGRRLASASADGTIKVWDVENGLELLALRQHTREVFAVTFSRGGRLLASTGTEGAVLVRGIPPTREVSTDEWPVIFTDDFEKGDPAGRWDFRNGRLRVEGGALRGETLPEGGPGIATALAVPRMASLPSAVEVRLDCWSPQPVNAEIKFHDDQGTLGLGVLLLGLPNHAFHARDHAGLILEERDGRYATLAADAQFRLVPGVRHHVRVLRFRGFIKVWVDGAEVVSAPADAIDAPVLHLQASAVGEGVLSRVLFLDNVQVRAPESARAEMRALDRVRSLFATEPTRADVLARLEADRSLDRLVRQLAREIASRRTETPQTLNNASWSVVRSAGRPPADYELALRRAEAACRMRPGDAALLNTLGVAQYRTGRDREAIETLSRASAIHASRPDGVEPSDLAFLAMALHRAGRRDEAAEQLARLRSIVSTARWEEDADALAMLREAVDVIEK